MKLCFIASQKPIAQETHKDLSKRYGDHTVEDCDVIVAIGGDGHMLDVLRAHMKDGKPVYGFNRGTVGFMMNDADVTGLKERIAAAEATVIYPLVMKATTIDGRVETATAINEVSLFRETRQSARIRISVNGKVRMETLTCDGVLLATPAGSTAYNLSAHGPILPIMSNLLALTPISPFRPRRWRGALLPYRSELEIIVQEPDFRTVLVTADNVEVRDVVNVKGAIDPSVEMRLLFDPGAGLEERIVEEQFSY